jgi:hypothetical protein
MRAAFAEFADAHGARRGGVLAILHEPSRHLGVPPAERRGREHVGDQKTQPHHQGDEASGRNEEPPDVTDDATDTL